ncbi:hypothetical protein Q1695_003587 [Nippostrongylus brasiliensis]|nr:hypothetical protein Q1695_003587 [Nippostrongylus brasiliensis]
MTSIRTANSHRPGNGYFYCNFLLTTVVAPLCASIAQLDALQCTVMNTVQGVFSQTCSANIVSCMKFVCRIRGYEQVYKGCNDPTMPAVACQTLQANCEAQGGTGQCYTCNYDFCNSSALLSFMAIVVAAFIALPL